MGIMKERSVGYGLWVMGGLAECLGWLRVRSRFQVTPECVQCFSVHSCEGDNCQTDLRAPRGGLQLKQ